MSAVGWLKQNNRDHKLPGDTYYSGCDIVVDDKQMFECDFCAKRFESLCLPCRTRKKFPFPNLRNGQRKTAWACPCCLYAASTALCDESLATVHKYTELSPAQNYCQLPFRGVSYMRLADVSLLWSVSAKCFPPLQTWRKQLPSFAAVF